MGNRDRRDGSGGAEPRCDRWEQLVRALDAGHAGLVPAVAALEAAATDQPGGGEHAVVPLMTSLNAPPESAWVSPLETRGPGPPGA